MESKTTCIVKGCEEARYTSKNGTKIDSVCSAHKNERQRKWYASNPGYKAEENLRYFQRNEGRRIFDKGTGYWQVMGTQHPASFACGLTPLHRIILWDKLNGKNVPCAECGGQLIWFSKDKDIALNVDHINGIRHDNRPENLDPVHAACNTKRAHRARKEAAA